MKKVCYFWMVSCVCLLGCDEQPRSHEDPTPGDLLQQLRNRSHIAAGRQQSGRNFCLLVHLVCSSSRWSSAPECGQLRQACPDNGRTQDDAGAADNAGATDDAGVADDASAGGGGADRDQRKGRRGGQDTGPAGDPGTADEETPSDSPRSSGGNSSCNTVDTIVADMTGDGDVEPRSPWTDGSATVEAGNDAPSWASDLTGWGEVYRDITDADDTNTKVEVRNMRVYLLSQSTGQWTLLNSTVDVGYGGYQEDYSGSAPLEEEQTTSDGGTAVKIPHGSVFHFWPSGGNVVPVDTDDIGGIFVAVQGRLVVADSSQPDDTATARYLLSLGADYYGNGMCCSEADPNGEVGGSRFKRVTTDWRWYNFTTIASQISSNPPPLECVD